MKTIFFGTPETAVPYLNLLNQRTQIAAVVTRADHPAFRGQHLHKSEVKQEAEKLNLPILQPEKLKNPEFQSQLRAFNPECAIVVAYGKILPKEIIHLFPKGMFNIHFSLLPHLRGAAPIQWAILNGDSKTGVSCFRIEESLDSGRIVGQKEIAIEEDDDARTLRQKLIPLGLEVLDETLKRIENDTLKEILQSGTAAYAPLIRKQDAKINWKKSALEISRQVRGLIDLGAWATLPNGRILKILKAKPMESPLSQTWNQDLSGTITAFEKGQGFLVQCLQGLLLITRVQPEGKKEMDAWSFLQGSHLKISEVLK